MEQHERLSLARTKAGFENATAAADRFGWNRSTYLSHENGSRGLRADVARRYARAFKVSAEWLMFGTGDELLAARPDLGDDLVPIYDAEVSAGNGLIPGDQDAVIDHLAFPPNYLRTITSAPLRNLAIVTVKGDSMSPTLREGDVVMIDTMKRNLGYDGLFVLRIDGALHVKRISRGGRVGMVRILSDNHAIYPPAERDLSEVEPVGKVLWYGRKE